MAVHCRYSVGVLMHHLLQVIQDLQQEFSNDDGGT